jgi:hypothetical protein
LSWLSRLRAGGFHGPRHQHPIAGANSRRRMTRRFLTKGNYDESYATRSDDHPTVY